MRRKRGRASYDGTSKRIRGILGCEWRRKGTRRTPSPNSEQLTELLTIFCTIQITVEDFWLLFLARSPHSTVEEMEADLDAHEADVDAGLPPFREKVLANLA